MIKFILKGLLRDRSRSLFPLLTVMIGVLLTVLLFCWIKGAETNFIEASAKFESGHVKIMSRAYSSESDQIPNDLAYIGVGGLLQGLKQDFPEMIWAPRIKFGGLLDVPDETGETRSQGPVAGMAVDLFSENSEEGKFLELEKTIVRGGLPAAPGEILISEDFAQSLEIQPGETATLISSTMYGSMSTYNFVVAGTIRFGITAMDRGAMVADLADIQKALDMEDAAGEILGLFNDLSYRDAKAEEVTAVFNDRYAGQEDEFLPVMDTLRNSSGMGDILDMIGVFVGAISGIFLVAMSIVLWNAGLMGSLRRYGEIGVRLAIGEKKGRLYRSMMMEALMIGFVGTILGTVLGLALAYYLQAKGINIAGMMKNSTLLISDVFRAKVTPVSYVIGFLPGMVATFLGSAISGIGIYRRQTSQLMKELEV